MEYVVDVQGFMGLNGFMPKDLAIVPLQENALPTVCHFKPSCNWNALCRENQKCNDWLHRNFHGLAWTSGDIPYGKYPKILHENLAGCRKIFVKGLEKQKWLEKLLPSGLILNLDDIRCPSLRMLRESQGHPILLCKDHLIQNPVCAVQNVELLRDWILNCFLKYRGPPRHTTTCFMEVDDEDYGEDEVDKFKGDCVTMDPPFEPLSESMRNSDEYKKQVLYSMYT